MPRFVADNQAFVHRVSFLSNQVQSAFSPHSVPNAMTVYLQSQILDAVPTIHNLLTKGLPMKE